MFAIRIHGRGGQGVVTGAELLSVAAFLEGRHAQAFPSFGSERTGAPVVAFCRIDDREIRLREPIEAPDAVIVQDPTLLHSVDVFQGLAADGHVLINSARSPVELGLEALLSRPGEVRVRTVDATALALEHIGRPVPNAVLLGAFAAQCPIVTIASVCAAIRERFPTALAERNVRAATAAHDAGIATHAQGVAHAQAD
jgi:pyruvate ferredoxin oxidoreductase gamma subunit